MLEKLDVIFRGDMTNRFIGFKSDIEEDFREKMLLYNNIPGYLAMNVKYEDGEKIYCYDISGKKSVAEVLGEKAVDKQFLHMLFSELEGIFLRGKGYMFEEDNYCIHPDALFISDDDRVGVCYVPGYERNVHMQLEEMAEYLMDRVDSEDKESVYAVYRICTALREPNCTFATLLLLIENSDRNIKEIDNEVSESIKNADGIREEAEKGSGQAEVRTSGILEKLSERILNKEENENNKEEERKNLISMAMAVCFILAVVYFVVF